MNSVERILHYVESADPEKSGTSEEPPIGWPSCGEIRFEKLSMRYRSGLDLVLRDLDFTVAGGETVGICGRTGAGKSSLMLALFRMVEPASGCVRIDGVDTRTIRLQSLRRSLSLIPQDPVLFSGAVRFNLDPQEKYSADDELWRVLERVHLDAKVRRKAGSHRYLASSS